MNWRPKTIKSAQKVDKVSCGGSFFKQVMYETGFLRNRFLNPNNL